MQQQIEKIVGKNSNIIRTAYQQQKITFRRNLHQITIVSFLQIVQLGKIYLLKDRCNESNPFIVYLDSKILKILSIIT